MSTKGSSERQLNEFSAETINLSHGSGGKAMRDLIDTLFVKEFDNAELDKLEDQARLDLSIFVNNGDRLAFTTDSYVVNPPFFPGGDIGSLSVYGTVNDLAVGGAQPLFLSCSMIIEEGFAVADLEKLCRSIATACRQAGVSIVTGDTKVVEKGAGDKIFINTAGIGVVPRRYNPGSHRAEPGDVVLLNGYIGDHGGAILSARGDLNLKSDLKSDCQPLHQLTSAILEKFPDVHCMRDATRGGLATVLNEFARSSRVCITINEQAVPIRSEVRGLCEILGLDPLYLANEGKVVVVVPEEAAAEVLETMQAHTNGQNSAIVGRVTEQPQNTVILKTTFGTERIVDMLVGDQLPRIC